MKYRNSTATDIPFIIDSWAKSFYGAPSVKGCPRDVYFPHMHSLIVRILSRRLVTVKVACDDGDEDLILGWACVEGDALHYLFVRHGASELVDRAEMHGPGIVRFTHRTHHTQVDPAWAYVPFLAWTALD